jgi:hypothetical protein
LRLWLLPWRFQHRFVVVIAVKVALVPQIEGRAKPHGRIPQRIADHFLDCIAPGFRSGVTISKARLAANGKPNPQAAQLVHCGQAVRSEGYRLPRPILVTVKKPGGQGGVPNVIQMDRRKTMIAPAFGAFAFWAVGFVWLRKLGNLMRREWLPQQIKPGFFRSCHLSFSHVLDGLPLMIHHRRRQARDL